MSGCRCVIFDMDDTLYLERQYVWSGFHAVQSHLMMRFNSGHFAELAWSEFLQGRRGTIFNEALIACGIEPTASLIHELVSVYRHHTPQISLLQDSIDCLEKAKEKFRIGLLTDGPLPSQRAKAKALKLYRWMDVTVFTAELGHGFGKPHPAGFRFIQQCFGCSGPECTYIGDNPIKDFVAAKAMNWTTIRIRRKNGLHEAVKSGADVSREIESLSELPF
jgi:putative hydrolase of the HAD superfamily